MRPHPNVRFFDVGTKLLHSGGPLQQPCWWRMHYHAAVAVFIFTSLPLLAQHSGGTQEPICTIAGRRVALSIRWSKRFPDVASRFITFFLSGTRARPNSQRSQTGDGRGLSNNRDIFCTFWGTHDGVYNVLILKQKKKISLTSHKIQKAN